MNPYTVSLRDADNLPSSARIKAECIYAAVLERRLGGAEIVAATYRAWIEATESTADVLTAEVANTAAQWPPAARDAEQAAMRDVGHFEGQPHFEVRLNKLEPVT